VLSNRKERHRTGKIQLIDVRDRYAPMKRSLGNKRRYLDEETIDAVSRQHGRRDQSETSKIYDGTDFGYRRVTIQRPLRLRFQVTTQAKDHFLNTFPELLDAILAIEDAVGTEPSMDWNQSWAAVQQAVKKLPKNHEGWAGGARGTAQKKGFRDAFTETDPDAKPVIKESAHEDLDVTVLFPGQTLPALPIAELRALLGIHPGTRKGKQIEYEPDPRLKDFENIPLKEDIISYVLREVRPYVADAWIDRTAIDEVTDQLGDGGVGKVGYEINFNREFFRYQPPRQLKEIDADLAAVEKRILGLLQQVAE
jgi:type I restriction enzyme M protein